jgi:glycine/D-amino acid oxidase-like deaminating enzyme
MEHAPAVVGGSVTDDGYPDLPVRSPWIAQLAPLGDPRPLAADVDADVAIVGAGIAGIATAFFTLRSTDLSVVVLERDRVAHGASGRNAGQLTTYFERPLYDIAAQFGDELAIEGQRAFDDAHDLLDLLVAESGATVRIERFTGHMGMFALDHVLVHLRNNRLRRDGGLRTEPCVVSEDAPFLGEIPAELADLYTVVPQARIRELLETDDDRYRAVLSDRKGCANSAMLCQQVLAHLERQHPDRLRFADRTEVQRIVVGPDGVELHANGHVVRAAHVVLCTNGYTRHAVEDEAGSPLVLHPEQQVVGTYGFMAAFAEEHPRPPAAMSYLRNQAIGSGEAPYVYITRRTYDRPDDAVTLTCMGGPEWPHEGVYDPWAPFPGALLTVLDAEARPYAQRARPAGQPYDFHWHGLMGYMDGMVRVIGAHPGRPSLLYNLGCNGVGFLPSIHGGRQIGRLLAGERLPPSVFDPR